MSGAEASSTSVAKNTMSIFLKVDVKRHTDHRNGRYKHKGEIWSNTHIDNGFVIKPGEPPP
jgi:hypothetical protein